MNNFKTSRGILGASVLRAMAVMGAVGMVGTVQAFDYLIYTHTQANSTSSPWSTTFTLPAYTGTQTLDSILITYTSTLRSRFRVDNDDAGAGATLTLNYTASVTLTPPGGGSPTVVNSVTGAPTKVVAPDNGDGDAVNDFTGPDGFDELVERVVTQVYSVPVGNFASFVSSTPSFAEAAAATSSVANGTANMVTLRNNTAGTVVTLQYVLVPEASTAWAFLPVAALAAGVVVRRRRA